ncbi:MAG: magnesium transporter [Planctomycetia bacterium]|nr:magnesium transporter [Planctomycetia bacterium]
MYDPLLLPELREMLIENDARAMQEFCEVFHPGVVSENLEALSVAECWSVLSHTSLTRRVEVFEFLTLPRQMELVATLDKKDLSALLEAMASDDRVALLKNMDQAKVELLLPLIAQAERGDIRKLLSYPEHSAGSIMTTDYASLPEGVTVRDALAQLRTQAPDRETIYYVYVIDDARHLHGFVSLRKLFLARPDALVSELMDKDVISVRVDEDQEVVANRIARYDFIAMPVVDDQGRLVGIVTHDDVLDVLQQEATEDVHRLGGVEPLEDGYLSTPLITLAWKRGIWLVLLLVAGFGTAAILSHYKSETQKSEWLVLFLPLVLASGGNAGSQSATLVIRALALGQLNRETQARIGRRELYTGLLLGATLALMGFTFARFYVSTADAAVVAGTVALVVTFGTVNGTLLPIILKQLGMDPALMSNPLIASLSDMVGVLIYYNVALLALGG